MRYRLPARVVPALVLLVLLAALSAAPAGAMGGAGSHGTGAGSAGGEPGVPASAAAIRDAAVAAPPPTAGDADSGRLSASTAPVAPAAPAGARGGTGLGDGGPVKAATPSLSPTGGDAPTGDAGRDAVTAPTTTAPASTPTTANAADGAGGTSRTRVAGETGDGPAPGRPATSAPAASSPSVRLADRGTGTPALAVTVAGEGTPGARAAGAGHAGERLGDGAGNASGGEHRGAGPAVTAAARGADGARSGPGPDVSPRPAGHGGHAADLTATVPRAAQHQGGRDGARGGDRPAGDGGGRHGRPAAPEPAAPAARTGLEPPPVGDARGRKGDLALPGEAPAPAPDPLLLLRFLLFLGYRRVRPANLLDHPVRRGLYDAVSADPGLDLAGCVAATGANRETLRYHLCLLVVGGRVVEEERNGSVRYFPAGAALPPAHRALLHHGRNPSLAPILDLVRRFPGVSRKDLAGALGVAGPTVTRQVGRLVADGLVEQERCGRSQCYRLTPECAAAYAAIEAARAVPAEPGQAAA